MKTKIISCLLAIICLLLGAAHPAFGQGIPFTYQGRLTDGSSPVNGNYDLTFSVFDALSGGTQVSINLTNVSTPVSNGLFTGTLDFGAGLFPDDPRWLEIGVATNGGGFATLSPRQALLPTPYAIHASTASDVVPGSVVKSLNALKDDVTLAAGSNVTITPSGNTLTIDSAGAGGSGIWNLNGASAYYTNGNVGIGTANPQEKLTIAGVTSFNNGLKLTGNSINGTGIAIENTSSGGHKFDLLSGGVNDGIGVGAFGLFDETMGSYPLAIATNGNVGIGTSTPGSKLEVAGNTRINGQLNINHFAFANVTMALQTRAGDTYPINVDDAFGNYEFGLLNGSPNQLQMIGDAVKTAGGTSWGHFPTGVSSRMCGRMNPV